MCLGNFDDDDDDDDGVDDNVVMIIIKLLCLLSLYCSTIFMSACHSFALWGSTLTLNSTVLGQFIFRLHFYCIIMLQFLLYDILSLKQ